MLAPKSKADLAFIMHSLAWLAPNGTAAIVCFPGVLYRGGAEKKIRQYLVDNNFIDCIIQLPSNLFFGTSIATCIMVLKKNKQDNKVLFMDASRECIKVTNNNKLTPENIDRIVDVFAARREEAHFSQLASRDDIAAQEYNPFGLDLCGGGGHPGENRHRRAERRDRPDRGPGAGPAAGD